MLRLALSLKYILTYVVILSVAFIARVFNLAYINTLLMDELYYVKDAWSINKYGYEAAWVELNNHGPLSRKMNELFELGIADVYDDYFDAVHPPFGKLLIGLGMLGQEQNNAFAWRISAVIAGVAIVAVIMLIVWNITKSHLITGFAGILSALEPMLISHSRISHLDVFLSLMLLIATLFAVKYVLKVKEQPDKYKLFSTPYIVLASIFLGLATGTKWSGVYFTVPIGLLILATYLFAWRKTKAPENSEEKALTISNYILPVLRVPFTMFIIFFTTYLVTWTQWFMTWGARESAERGVFPLATLFRVHEGIYYATVSLLDGHILRSKPQEWLLNSNPTIYWEGLYTYDLSPEFSYLYCDYIGDCRSIATMMPNMIFWLLGIMAAIVLIYFAIRQKNLLLALPAALIATGWLPWFLFYEGRNTYQFYTIAFSPYVIIALFMIWNVLKDKKYTNAIFTRLVVLGSILSLVMYPLATGVTMPVNYIGYEIYDTYIETLRDAGLYDESQLEDPTVGASKF